MKKYFLGIFLFFLLLFVTLPASAFNYEFYHVAVRDYNGDAVFNNGDHMRYGFKLTNADGSWADLTGWKALGWNESGLLETVDVGGGVPYLGAYNTQSYSEDNYWAAKFHVNGIKFVHLRTAEGDNLSSHPITLPDITQPFSSYNGFDADSVTWQRHTGGWLFSWDEIASPSTEPSSYRISLADDSWAHEILFTLNENQTELFLTDELMGVSDIWQLQFQQRFANPDQDADNFNWLRSYGMTRDISLGGGPLPTPIPGSIWLLGTGLIGIFRFRKKFKK
jgi:hypothetical protein